MSKITCNIFCGILFACLLACNKDKIPSYSITYKGRVIHEETGQGIAGAAIYTDYGEPCCGGLAKKLGSDSTFTDAQGYYSLTLTYPQDTIIYRFITYLKSISLEPKFYYYFGTEIQDYGVVQFDYDQMVTPTELKKVPDQLIKTCNFSVLPIGVLHVTHIEKTPPIGGDTIRVTIKRIDQNKTYQDYSLLADHVTDIRLAIIAGVKTEITQKITNAGGYLKTRRDTVTMIKGEKRPLRIEH